MLASNRPQADNLHAGDRESTRQSPPHNSKHFSHVLQENSLRCLPTADVDFTNLNSVQQALQNFGRSWLAEGLASCCATGSGARDITSSSQGQTIPTTTKSWCSIRGTRSYTGWPELGIAECMVRRRRQPDRLCEAGRLLGLKSLSPVGDLHVQSKNRRLPLWRDPLRDGGRACLQSSLSLS